MKRSEMLDLMSEEIIHIEDGDDVERLLDKMEKAGMLPPPYYTEKDIELSMKEPDLFIEQQYFGYEGVRRWEPEND